MQGEELNVRTIFQAMAEGFVLQTRDGKIVDANPAAEVILGLTRDQLLGKSSLDIDWRAVRQDGTTFPGEEHPSMVTLETGKPIRNQLMGVRARDVALRWISINTQPIFGDSQSQPTAVISTFTDVTQSHLSALKIAETLAEKDVLLREIHHRVKNNMQVISSLLSLQGSHIRDAKYVAMFAECERRIRSMALVHEQLYRSSSVASIDFGEYLGELSKLILRSQQTVLPNVNIIADCDPVNVGLEMAVPLGLIANELMSNAFIHAFRGRKSGKLVLNLKRTGAQTALMSISDNGVGLPAELDIEQTKSMGLYIVKNLVRQIRATLSFHEATNGGSCFEIALTLAP
jgi:PAS domain S-box-containing protein